MSFLVFDIETRVDKALLRATQFRGQSLSEDDAYERMRDAAAPRVDGRSDFFPLTLHVPISIALGEVGDDYVLQRRRGARRRPARRGRAGAGEFWRRLEAFDGTLVSFNGRGFDLPVLELQALRHGCARAALLRRAQRPARARSAVTAISTTGSTNFGASRLRGGFDLVAKLVGLPGKGAVSGADVQALWERGRWDEIHRYCADDVLQTYFLFLRVEHLRGRLERPTTLARGRRRERAARRCG